MSNKQPALTPQQVDDTDSEVPIVEEEVDSYQLPRGDVLREEDVNRHTLAADCRVILFSGAARCGKTTLLLSVYEKLLKGSLGRWIFAGSETLPGFEERCYESRAESDRDEPDTARTHFETEAAYLHLKISDKQMGERQAIDLFFTDLAGEAFRLAKDSQHDCEQTTVLRNADHVVLLVDGAKLCLDEERDAAVDEVALLLRRCVECQMLGSRTLVDIVLTKLDIVERHENREATRTYWGSVCERLKLKYSTIFGRLRFESVAARPVADSEFNEGHGVTQLLHSWIEDSLRSSPFTNWTVPVASETRQIDLVEKRMLMTGILPHV